MPTSFRVLTGWNWGWLTAMARARNVNAFLSVTQLGGSAFARMIGVDSETVLGLLQPFGVAVAAVALLLLIRRPHDQVRTLALLRCSCSPCFIQPPSPGISRGASFYWLQRLRAPIAPRCVLGCRLLLLCPWTGPWLRLD
ncbi:MAG: hypothetical protein R2706_10470 [Acidimicrobiales bacterium]